MKKHGKAGEELSSFLTLALYGGEQSTSHVGLFNSSQYPECLLNRSLGGTQNCSGHFLREKFLASVWI